MSGLRPATEKVPRQKSKVHGQTWLVDQSTNSFETLLEMIFLNAYKELQPSRSPNLKIGHQNICQNIGRTDTPIRKAGNEKMAHFQGSG
jgi:hypothetical protein